MPGWQQVKMIVCIEIIALAVGKWDHVDILSPVPCLNQRMGAFGTNDRPMLGEVIGMRMRNKGGFSLPVRIKPQVEFWQMKSVPIADFGSGSHPPLLVSKVHEDRPVGDADTVFAGSNVIADRVIQKVVLLGKCGFLETVLS